MTTKQPSSRARAGLRPRGSPALHAVDRWFARQGWAPFAFQHEVWAAFRAGESGLIHAATGTGKTYAAWFGPVLEWVDRHPSPATPPPRLAAAPLRVLWITPLRALAADTEAALRAPVDALGLPWTVESRTGDTPAKARARQQVRLPTALVTTPESLSLILTRSDAPSLFEHLECIVVDEWHELMSTKRGVQTELALARLRRIRPALRTWGLSATLGNLDGARDSLLGLTDAGEQRPGRVVRGLVPKQVVIDALIPDTIERFPWAGHLGVRLLDHVIAAIADARSALVFTNTRSQAELWFQAILAKRPEWTDRVALHHGSLDRLARDAVQRGLKLGHLRAVVCTSSLDLGVDFTPVDRVLQIGSPKGVARLLQRAGRSGHQPGAISRITCVPTHAFELVEVAAARDAAQAGALDQLAQQAVTVALGGGFTRDEFLAEVRTAYAYRDLTDEELDWVLDFVTRGGAALHAYPEYRKVTVSPEGRYEVRDRRVAQRHRMTVGTIVSDAAITVRYLRGPTIGTVEESFVARLRPRERFVFGGKALEFVRLRDLTAWVRRAKSVDGSVPRWAGTRMPLSSELADAVRRKLDEARRGQFVGPEMAAVRPVLELQAARSAIPGRDELLIERVETRDGSHLFFYPFEGRLVHEGLGALFAYRLAQLGPISFSVACNDYGIELLSAEPARLDEGLTAGLLEPRHLVHDIPASLNAAELARRQFREVARVAGLVFPGFPGQNKSVKRLQASSGLIYDVFARYDPGNLLLHQAQREVLERQLERSRLARALARLSDGRVTVLDLDRPTPLAFPILVDRTRERVSSEKLADRVRRMALSLERDR